MTKGRLQEHIILLVESERVWKCSAPGRMKKVNVCLGCCAFLNSSSVLVGTTRNLDALGTSEKIQGRITFRVGSGSLNQSSDVMRVGDQVNQANQTLDHNIRTPAILDTSERIVDLAGSAKDSANTLYSYLKPLLDNFGVFVKVVDQLAEVYDSSILPPIYTLFTS
jgi:hypothetical protein